MEISPCRASRSFCYQTKTARGRTTKLHLVDKVSPSAPSACCFAFAKQQDGSYTGWRKSFSWMRDGHFPARLPNGKLGAGSWAKLVDDRGCRRESLVVVDKVPPSARGQSCTFCHRQNCTRTGVKAPSGGQSSAVRTVRVLFCFRKTAGWLQHGLAEKFFRG